MFGRTTNRTPVIKTGDLPVLPAFHTPEQLAEWRRAVAALPGPVHVPPRPTDLDASPHDTEAHRRAVLVAHEQEMQRQAQHIRTDPREIARRNHLAQVEIAYLDQMIGQLQARRAEVNARIVLDTPPG